jgi:chromate transporter
VSLGLLFALLLKASVTSFSGMGALPQLRQDLVVTHHVIDDEQLSRAVLLGRSTPGPIGIYIVSVGYAVRGVPGAIAGWIALALPAFLAVPMLIALRRWLHQPRLLAAVDAVVIGGATLLVPSAIALLRDGYAQLVRVLS